MENEIDYDLESCLEYNPQKGYTVDDIEIVLAVWEGANEGDDWRWILQLKNGSYVLLEGGCDYTGWDCQSWATSWFFASVEEALDNSKLDSREETRNDVYESLKAQLAEGKNKTWRENKGDELGNPPFVNFGL